MKHYWQIALNLFRDYSDHSTIHGVTYLGERGRSWFERLWWIVAIGVSVLCSAKLIFDVWNIDPIIITFTAKPTPIWKIPFPAVSICPNMLTHYKHINLTQTVYDNCMGLTNQNQIAQLHAVSMICPYEKIFFGEPDQYPMSCNGCLKTIRQIRIPPDDMFVECKFKNQTINCLDSVREVVANYAFCYTFNGLEIFRSGSNGLASQPSEEWNIDDGYKSSGNVDVYPHRASGAGLRFGFSALLRMSKYDINYKCTMNPGFYLEYRVPYEFPELRTRFLEIPVGTVANVVLTPKMIIAAKELHHYRVSERKCYFVNERRLKYFNQYTPTNCELECEIDYILKVCGCLPIYFNLNLFKEQKGIDTCGYARGNCMQLFEQTLKKTVSDTCKCLPTCNTISYDAEVLVTSLNMSASPKFQEDYEYAQINIYFKENQLMTSERQERYGRTDFLANCGGLLGLFLGISFISILEIFYFCTVRLWYNLKKPVETIGDPEEMEDNHYDRSNRYVKIMKNLITDYSSKTTIQGINYVADSNLTLFERSWWTIIIVISVFCCGFLILDVVRHYDQSPIIVSYANEETPISQIPFPAITICPQVVGRLARLWHLWFKVQKYPFYTDIEPIKEKVTALAQICDPEMFGDLDPENRTNCDNCVRQLRTMMPDISEITNVCFYNYLEESCSDIFEEMITEDGICHTFNGVRMYRRQDDDIYPEWNLDDGYINSTEEVSPRRGSRMGLTLTIQIGKDLNDGGICKDPVQGHKIYIHLPNESPQISKHYYLAPYNQEVHFFADPKVINTAPELRELPVTKRHCYFGDERYLRFFKHYTQNNCEEECVANLTLTKCGCLRFHMPKVPGVKFCGIGDLQCYHQVIEQNFGPNQQTSCQCLPTCNSISYDVKVENIKTPVEALQAVEEEESLDRRYNCVPTENGFDFNSEPGLLTHQITSITISFKEHQFVAMERSQLYGPTELVANFGGLLGLFLGFSLMSVLELVYFCTLRWICKC